MKSKSSDSGLFIQKYMFKEKKGEVGFGRAFVIYDRETKKEYISKFIIIEEDKKNDKESIKHKNDLFKREIEILNDLKTKNMIILKE